MLRGLRFKGFKHIIESLRALNNRVVAKNKYLLARNKYKINSEDEFNQIENELKLEYTPWIMNKISYEMFAKKFLTDIWKSSSNDYIIHEKTRLGGRKCFVRKNFIFCSCLKPISIGNTF